MVIFSVSDLIRGSKIFDKHKETPSPERFQAACDCLSYIVRMKSSELIHVFRLDDEERELDEDVIECEILKTFLNCKEF